MTTEPTPEQVEAERVRARDYIRRGMACSCESCERNLSIALARVRIEAHAAGRDEALREAAEVVKAEHLEDPQNNEDDAYDAALDNAEKAIRALRWAP